MVKPITKGSTYRHKKYGHYTLVFDGQTRDYKGKTQFHFNIYNDNIIPVLMKNKKTDKFSHDGWVTLSTLLKLTHWTYQPNNDMFRSW